MRSFAPVCRKRCSPARAATSGRSSLAISAPSRATTGSSGCPATARVSRSRRAPAGSWARLASTISATETPGVTRQEFDQEGNAFGFHGDRPGHGSGISEIAQVAVCERPSVAIVERSDQELPLAGGADPRQQGLEEGMIPYVLTTEAH